MTELTDEHIAHDLELVDAARYHRHFSGCYRTGVPICKEQSFSDNLLDKYEAVLREVQRLRTALENTRTIAKKHSKGGPLAGAYEWFMQEIDEALEGAKDGYAALLGSPLLEMAEPLEGEAVRIAHKALVREAVLKERRRERQRCLEAVDAEEELPGEIPDDLLVAARDDPEQFSRAVVRVTKASIRRRIKEGP